MTGFTIERDFDAAPDLLWRAWTDPTLAQRWWCPKGFTVLEGSVSIDLRVGGHYSYIMVSPGGEQYPTGGHYREVEPRTKLTFTWAEPDEEDRPGLPVITVELEASGTGTRQRFSLEGIAGQPGDDNVFDGWSEAFDNLDAALPGA